MARRPKRQYRRRNSRRGGLYPKFEIANTLGTLANGALLSQDAAGNLQEKAFLVSVKATWNRRGGTVGEGPIKVGVAHSDYSNAEIEEWIEDNTGWAEGNMISQEISSRKIRQVGVFSAETADESLNDGRPIRTKCGWQLQTGDTLTVWAHNRSGGTLTTGTVIITDGSAFLRKN